MPKFKDTKRMRQFMILNNYDFLEERLRGQDLPRFKQMIDQISINVDFSQKYKNQTVDLGKRLKNLISVVDQCVRDTTLLKTFKKLALVHMLLRISIRKNQEQDECFNNTVVEVLNSISKVDFEGLKKKKQGTNGLEKIKAFLSSKTQELVNITSIENHQSKQVIIEIVENVYRPFSLYLLKITQDREIYSKAMKKQAFEREMLWKIINLTKQLGVVAASLNRVYRYFRVQLEGILSHLSYIISIDAKIYYDCLRQSISNKCKTMSLKIISHELKKTEDYEIYIKSKSEIASDPDFNELQHLLAQLQTVRQDIFWIYLNKELKQSVRHFDKPHNGMKLEPDDKSSHITFVQSFIDRNRKLPIREQQRKRNHRSSIDSNLQFDFVDKEHDFCDVSTGLSIPQSNSDEGEQL